MRTAEVVIVGGGCMGASLAWHLAQRGLTDLVIVEREAQLASGSSGRNAGGVRHQFSQEANIRLSIESIRAFERFGDEVGAAIDFHQDGYLFLLSTHAEDQFRRSVALQRRLGVEVEWLPPAEAARLATGVSVEGVSGATFCHRDGICDPAGVTMAYAGAARRAGVAVLTETEVTGLRVRHGRLEGVDTIRGPIDAPVVVNAAGPWSRHVGRLAGLDVPVDPVRRHIFIARPGAGTAWDDAPHRRRVPSTRIMVIDFETTFYCHREGPGLLFGMGDPSERPGFDTTVRWDFLPAVIEVATRRVPALADAAVSHAWAGLYEMTPDAMPLIGPAGGLAGYYLLTGFSGHGFQHCPAAGRVLADLICGRDPGIDVTPFAPDRFAGPHGGGEHHVV
jgi:sarcosine oxidase subunit beta